ncbi:hypothetical protein [Acidiphilium sp. C61]|uniref:hypothetical protein n=1 Tax=Acidiphilium sp. C61 TaxID=1671485 RepID=UPI001F20A81B|nr:hypothetical protein [Acidiphilium sp. C61]
MKFVQHSVRLPLTLSKALQRAAQARETSTYALLQQCVRVGIASLSDDQTAPQLTAEIAQEIGALAARLAHVERLTERTLFVACAAYTYARAAAGPSADQSKLTQAIQDAFTRQIKLAGDS